MIYELVNGKWIDCAATSLGLLGPGGAIIGFIAKLILHTTDPENTLQERIAEFIGSLLKRLSPSSVKQEVQTSVENAKTIQKNVEKKLPQEEQKEKLKQDGGGARRKNKNPYIDSNSIESIRFLFKWKNILCSKEFDSVFESIRKNPPVLLILQLHKIPLTKESLCREEKEDKEEPIEMIEFIEMIEPSKKRETRKKSKILHQSVHRLTRVKK
jgi:hypothetical protein